MSVDKLVDSTQLDASLTYEAGKLRAKLGSSAQLDFDLANGKGFGDYIDAIPSGGGEDNLDKRIARNLTTYSNSSFTGTVPSYVFYELTSLVSVTFGEAKIFGTYLFQYCSKLESITAPKVYELRNFCMSYMSKIQKIVLPAFKYSNAGTMRDDTLLSAVDLGSSSITATDCYIGVQVFMNDSALNVLVIRNSKVVALQNINSFQSTPFASGKAGGTLYVPSTLISSYQSATNWSTILGYTNNQIKSIESTHTDPTAPIDLTLYYADGTPIT
jgi:hypothetical protein